MLHLGNNYVTPNDRDFEPCWSKNNVKNASFQGTKIRQLGSNISVLLQCKASFPAKSQKSDSLLFTVNLCFRR